MRISDEGFPLEKTEINTAQQDTFMDQVRAAAGRPVPGQEDARWLAVQHGGEAGDHQINETERAITPFALDDGRIAVYAAKNGVYTLAVIGDSEVEKKPGVFSRSQTTYVIESEDAPGSGGSRFCEVVKTKWFVNDKGERFGGPGELKEDQLVHVPSKFEALARGEEAQADALRTTLVLNALESQLTNDNMFTTDHQKKTDAVYHELSEGRAHIIPLTPDLELAVR